MEALTLLAALAALLAAVVAGIRIRTRRGAENEVYRLIGGKWRKVKL
jgi:hypothetical protein